MFQHTAAQRRLLDTVDLAFLLQIVSTHSRAEATASLSFVSYNCSVVSTHSRAEATASTRDF